MPPRRSDAPYRRRFNQRPTGVAVLLCLLVACGLAVSACACSLPVFRFALDRWSADNFRMLVSEDDAADPEVARFLRNFGSDSGLNLEIQRSSQGPSRLFRPPHGDSPETTLWEGRASEPWLRALGESPASTEIVNRLLAGDSAVWVLVESNDPQANETAASVLEKRLVYLQQAIHIPPADPNDLSSRPGPGPELAVRFSLVRIRASSAAGEDPEKVLRATLAGPQSGLASSERPWFASVFGRGRVLGAWPAADFGHEQIDEICIFLSGACSCQVKRQNPGWDLLLKMDWEERLRAISLGRQASARSADSAPTTATLAAPSSSAAPEPETIRFEPTPRSENPPPSDDSPKRSAPRRNLVLPLVVLGLLLLTLANRKRLRKALK
jgi:hypothetical protein